jgi:hypothetical protein
VKTYQVTSAMLALVQSADKACTILQYRRRPVGGIRLGMAQRTERNQAVEIEVRTPLGALDDVVDLEGAPADRRPPRASGRAEEVKALSCQESWREGKEETTIIEEENQVGRLAVLTHGSPEAL